MDKDKKENLPKNFTDKLNIKTKIYLFNLFYYFLIFIGAILILAAEGTIDGGPFNWKGAYTIVSTFAVIYLGHVLAMRFTINHDK
ncbi:MAG: hypothetical protein UT53_C0001G0016 [Candidatus Yanofskybacteria bacterium GW2011_GWD2_39_48]|uniref:Uncharacterized protein n=1 Tax=Candidatus Yanofskybacteria bacterium GW2011_GWD2_39_48 TaxID=1619031 RepID=A0A0G0SED3_9BACT|nr:MAG: hypothetical protein UT53_C0001G0016 [Candidatus Yanofskybacteria bacterium GW2011_GWD2_39_48]